MHDSFIGGGCGFDQFCKQYFYKGQRESLQERSNYVKELFKTYPHQHDHVTELKEFDPLIQDLVSFFWKNKIETITSCQGNEIHSPYIYFYCKVPQILDFLHEKLRKWKLNSSGCHSNNFILNYVGLRENKQTFMLQFYDIIAVHRFLKFINESYNKEINIYD